MAWPSWFFHSSDGIIVKFQATCCLPELESSTASSTSGLSLFTLSKVLNGVVKPMSSDSALMPSSEVTTQFRKSFEAFWSASEAFALMHR